MLLYVHRNRRFIRDGSPGRPPRLSHSSWALGGSTKYGVDLFLPFLYATGVYVWAGGGGGSRDGEGGCERVQRGDGVRGCGCGCEGIG